MNKTYLIFRHEFLVTVKKTGFKILTLLMPLLVILIIIIAQSISGMIKSSVGETKTIGYVDETGNFNRSITHENIKLIAYSTTEEARRSLIRNDISEYFVIGRNYLKTGVINRYTLEKELITPINITHFIKDYLTSNLLAGKVTEDTASLIKAPLNLAVIRLDKTGAIDPEQGGFGNLIIPGLFALMLAFYLNINSNIMSQGLGYEKENRMIEVLLSSVSSRQLFTGKLLGLGTAGMLQVSLWLASAQLLYIFTGSLSGSFIGGISLPSNFIILGLIYFILGYLLFAVLSLGVGAISSDSHEAVRYTLIYSIICPFMPFWVLSLLINLPDNIICVVLTIFPFTAPVTTMIRIGISDVPAWQIIGSVSVMALTIAGLFFLAIKAFRMNLLMYGERPRLREII